VEKFFSHVFTDRLTVFSGTRTGSLETISIETSGIFLDSYNYWYPNSGLYTTSIVTTLLNSVSGIFSTITANSISLNNDISLNGNMYLPYTRCPSPSGIIFKNGIPFIHDYCAECETGVNLYCNNLFIGEYAGNFTMGQTATFSWQSSNNIGIGYKTLYSNTLGSSNVAIGNEALENSTTGDGNIAIGRGVLFQSTDADYNVVIGSNAGNGGAFGDYNVAVGRSTLYWLDGGDYNVALGAYAGYRLADGITPLTSLNQSILLGYKAKPYANGDINEIVIGYDAVGYGSNTVTLGNENITQTILRGSIGIGGITNPSYSLEVSGISKFWSNVHVPYPIEDTHAVNKEYVDLAVAAATWDFFLSDDSADIAGYYYLYENESGTSTTALTSPSLSTGNDQLLWSFVTESGLPNIDNLSIGVYSAVLFLQKSGNKTVNIYWKLFKREQDGTETELMTSETSSDLSTNVKQYILSSSENEDIPLEQTDRLVLKIYANVSGGGNNPQVTITMEGEYDSRIALRVESSAFSNVFVQKSGDTMYGTLYMNADILPSGTVTRSLGSSSLKWKDIYTSNINTETINDFITIDSDNLYVEIGTAIPPYESVTLEVAGRIYQSHLGNSTFLGYEAGANDDGTFNENVAIGYRSLYQNINGSHNVAVGSQSLLNNTYGMRNIAIGKNALLRNENGCDNIGIGDTTLYWNEIGSRNIAIGREALANDTASENIGIGYYALRFNTTGQYNIAIGNESAYSTNTGSNNTAIGTYSLYSNTTGQGNITIGYKAGDNITTGSYNIIIGHDVDAPSATGNNQLNIGNIIYGDLSVGKIGIRTYNPGTTLDVSGIIRGTNLELVSGIIYPSTDSTTAIQINKADSTTSVINIDTTNERIGIGTTSPNAKLEVAGRIYQSSLGYSTFIGYEAGKSDDLSSNTNTAIGYQSMYSNTSGYNNTSIGAYSLYSNTTGYYNVAVGVRALYTNTIGESNIAIGNSALRLNDEGSFNIAIGRDALYNNTNDNNIAIGYSALKANTTGHWNIAIGNTVLYNNTTGYKNVAIGINALGNSNGNYNTAIGVNALNMLSDGSWNVAIGAHALDHATNAGSNIAIGAMAANQYTTASNNIAIGTTADYNNNTGVENVVIGFRAGWPGWTGTAYDQDYRVIIGANAAANLRVGNTIFIGWQAGYYNLSGIYSVLIGNRVAFNNDLGAKNSVMIGYQAGHNSEGDNNVFIGYKAGYNETGDNKLYIANSDTSDPLIYGEFDNDTVKINDHLIVNEDLKLECVETLPTASAEHEGKFLYHCWVEPLLGIYHRDLVFCIRTGNSSYTWETIVSKSWT